MLDLEKSFPEGVTLRPCSRGGYQMWGVAARAAWGPQKSRFGEKLQKFFFFLILPLQSLVKFYVFKGVKTNSLNVHTLSLPPLCSLFCTEQPGPSSSSPSLLLPPSECPHSQQLSMGAPKLRVFIRTWSPNLAPLPPIG